MTTGESRNPPEVAPIAGHYAGLQFPEPRLNRPFVYLNMVTSVDGKAAVDGSERGLGSTDDKRMMQELRSHADAVLNGASTLRISGSSPRIRDERLRAARAGRGQQPQPLGVIVTRSGELPLDNVFFTARDFDAVVVVTEATPPDRVRAIRQTGRHVAVISDAPDNGIAIVELLRREYGVRWLLCEGGSTINSALFRAAVVDEIFLTFAPWIVGGSEGPTAVGGEPFSRESMLRLYLKQQFHDAPTDELFLRYTVAY